MKRKCLVLLMSVFCLGPAVAGMEFSSVDTDGDGFVSAQEAEADPMLKEALADFDQDNDGKLNEEEFTKSMEVLAPPDSGG